MKVLLINGSPKPVGSASGVLLEELKGYLTEEGVPEEAVRTAARRGAQAERAEDYGEADALVFAFPLYVDGIPSHLLERLVRLEPVLAEMAGRRRVYGIANCGFYEAAQNRLAIEMLKNWTARAGQVWGGGLGVGGGGMVYPTRQLPRGKGTRALVSAALRELAGAIARERTGLADLYAGPRFPRLLYRAAAQSGWRKQLKANGVDPREISRRLYP